MKPKFQPLTTYEMTGGWPEFRKISVPAHRYSPLKKIWMEIYTPVYEQMKIDIRMNLQARKVEFKSQSDTQKFSFEIKDVKILQGEHLSRAIGRLDKDVMKQKAERLIRSRLKKEIQL